MPDSASWPAAVPLVTDRLSLEPLRVEHAQEAFPFLDDVRLHAWTGGTPDSLTRLEARYRRQSAGRSPDGTQGWLNWMLRRASDGRPVGTVQATVRRPAPGHLEASLAWVIGVEFQGQGYGREAALAMARRLREQGVTELAAYIHPGHEASMGIARALGLTPSGVMVDGEVRWSESGE